jgi:hypothetical protein
LISAYIQRGLVYEAKGDYEHARQDFNATLEGVAVEPAARPTRPLQGGGCHC